MKVLGLALVVVGIAALWIAVKTPADPLRAIQEAIGSVGTPGRKPA